MKRPLEGHLPFFTYRPGLVGTAPPQTFDDWSQLQALQPELAGETIVIDSSNIDALNACVERFAMSTAGALFAHWSHRIEGVRTSRLQGGRFA